MKHTTQPFTPLLLGATALLLSFAPQLRAQETIGGGTVTAPAVGPAPSYGIGGPGMVLVKNWRFGANGTIKNYADMSANFLYHDQFGTIGNGTNYGAHIVAPDAADALSGQPIEGVNSPPVRKFTADSLQTFLTPLDGATTVDPGKHNAGCGAFMAKWKLPRAGSLLGRDLVWETRVRYVTPPYFWFALWTAGNKWNWNGGPQGAEQDLIESFGYDNGGGNTNYDGRYWHSNAVATPLKDTVDYGGWGTTMESRGIKSYDATQYHTWTWQYKKDNTYAMYVDGILVQSGSDYYWTFGNKKGDEPIDMVFLFDAEWGHTQIGSVNKLLPASAFDGKFYEFGYSRVYLSGDNSPAEAPFKGPHTLPGTVRAADYDTGGQTVSYYYQKSAGRPAAYRPHDLVALEASSDAGGGYAVTDSRPGQYLKYTVNAAKAGSYLTSFRVASVAPGGAFHLEDSLGTDLSGPISVPADARPGHWTTVSAIVAVPAGPQTLTLVQDAPGIKLNWFAFGKTVAPGLLANGKYRLLSASNGQALDVGGQKTGNGSGLDLYQFVGQANQLWTLHHLGDGVYEIVGAQSGRGLTSSGGSATISDYLGQPGQRWTITGAAGAYKIKSVADGRLFGADPAGNLSLAADSGLPGQVWKIEPAP